MSDTPSRLEVTFSPNNDGDSFERWKASLSDIIDVHRVETTPTDFQGRLALSNLGNALILETEAKAQGMMYSNKHIRRNGFDKLSLHIVLSGHLAGNYGDSSLKVQQNDLFLCDETKPSHRVYTDFHILGIYMPRKFAPQIFQTKNYHGLIFDGAAGVSRLLSAHIQQLASTYDRLAPEEASTAAEAAFLIASGAVQAKYALEPEHRAALDRTVKNLVVKFIDKHLSDPNLSAETLCAKFRLSRTALYRCFEPDGGVSRYIIDSRLDRCFDTLEQGAAGAVHIGELAFNLGFKSEAHFSRAFKQRFGLSPCQVRDSKQTEEREENQASHDLSVNALMGHWFRSCGK